MKKLLRRFLPVILPIVLIVIVGEVIVRIREQPPARPVEVAAWREYEPDATLGWAPVRGGAHVLRTDAGEVREMSNSFRLLGPETSESKPEGTFRVLLIGDSITEGLEVLRADRAATQLEEGLRSQLGDPVEVLNAGRSGYQTDQEVLLYETDGRRLGADVVVLVVFVGNDVIGNMQAANDTGFGPVPKPRFVLVNGELEVSVPAEQAIADRRATWTPIDAAKFWLAENVHLYRAARTAWAKVTGRAVPSPVPEVWQVFRRDPKASTEEAWALMEALLARLKGDVEHDHAQLLVALVPDEIQVDLAKWRSFIDAYRLRADEWDRDLPTRRLERICVARQLNCVDLVGQLRAAEDPYLPRGGHLGPSGHRLLAVALLRPLIDLSRAR